jgi:hypothetical protein
MPRLFACVSYGHLFYVRPYVEASDVVGVEEVVAEVVLGEVEWDKETRVIWRYPGGSDQSDCELGTMMCQLRSVRSFVICIQIDLLAAEGYQLLRDGYGVHGGVC